MKFSDEAIKKLKECQKTGDEEKQHICADKILCDFLRNLGFNNVVEEYKKISRKEVIQCNNS